VQKQKQKVVEDKTFGMKNKKVIDSHFSFCLKFPLLCFFIVFHFWFFSQGAKAQQFVEQIERQVFPR
jgi:hypothetical protein